MGKLVADAVLDAALTYISANGDWMSVCEGAPTTYEHGHSNKGTATGKVLAHTAAAAYTGPADQTNSPYGRKLTITQAATLTVDVSGTADHVAICKTSSTAALLYVTTCTSQVLTSGNTVTIPSWIITVGDPT